MCPHCHLILSRHQPAPMGFSCTSKNSKQYSDAPLVVPLHSLLLCQVCNASTSPLEVKLDLGLDIVELRVCAHLLGDIIASAGVIWYHHLCPPCRRQWRCHSWQKLPYTCQEYWNINLTILRMLPFPGGSIKCNTQTWLCSGYQQQTSGTDIITTGRDAVERTIHFIDLVVIMDGTFFIRYPQTACQGRGTLCRSGTQS